MYPRQDTELGDFVNAFIVIRLAIPGQRQRGAQSTSRETFLALPLCAGECFRLHLRILALTPHSKQLRQKYVKYVSNL